MNLELIAQLLEPVILSYAGKYGVVLQVLTWIGTARIIIKPLIVAIEKIVIDTPSKKDEMIFNRIKYSQYFKVALFFLDWLGSINLKGMSERQELREKDGIKPINKSN